MFIFAFNNRYVESESQRGALLDKLRNLQADQAVWHGKNAELENDLKIEREWRTQLQSTYATTNENLVQMSKDLNFYKRVASVS